MRGVIMQAWQARSVERQNQLEALKESFLTFEEEHGKEAVYSLLVLILNYLKGLPEKRSLGIIGNYRPEASFLAKMITDLFNFSGAEEEVVAVVTEFLVWVVQGSIAGPFQSALTAAEIANPGKFFGTASATDEVDL